MEYSQWPPQPISSSPLPLRCRSTLLVVIGQAHKGLHIATSSRTPPETIPEGITPSGRWHVLNGKPASAHAQVACRELVTARGPWKIPTYLCRTKAYSSHLRKWSLRGCDPSGMSSRPGHDRRCCTAVYHFWDSEKRKTTRDKLLESFVTPHQVRPLLIHQEDSTLLASAAHPPTIPVSSAFASGFSTPLFGLI